MGELLRKGQWPIPVERERYFGVINDDPMPDRMVYFIGPPEDGPIKIGPPGACGLKFTVSSN